jgi:hypothetical protein
MMAGTAPVMMSILINVVAVSPVKPVMWASLGRRGLRGYKASGVRSCAGTTSTHRLQPHPLLISLSNRFSSSVNNMSTDLAAANIKYFDTIKDIGHPDANRLVENLVPAILGAYPFNKAETALLDFGCGLGQYHSCFIEA